MIQLADADLLALLRNGEDSVVERKTVNDVGDAPRVVVSFANSAPIGAPCVIFIGVKSDGSFENKPQDWDEMQRKLRRKLDLIYPSVYYLARARVRDGENVALAYIVPGSALRPHFSGPSFIRVGSESTIASEAQYDNLIAQRSSKVYRLSQYLTKLVSVDMRWIHPNNTFTRNSMSEWVVVECNESWVIIKQSTSEARQSFPLKDVELSYDNTTKHLKIHATVYAE